MGENMRKLTHLAFTALICGTLAACSTMTPPRYSSNADNNVALRKLSDVNVAITELQLVLDRVEFSSSAGLTNGWWDISITLKNPSNGASLQASTHYDFRSGFDAITACTQTAQALTPAVQELIGRAVRGGQFEALVRAAR
jgi:hypothetical protein